MCNATQKRISLIHKKFLSPSVAAVFKEMSCYGNYADGTGIRPSNFLLAQGTKLSEKTVKRAKKVLRDMFLIVRTARHCMITRRSDEYRINHLVLDRLVTISKEMNIMDREANLQKKLDKKFCGKLSRLMSEQPVDKPKSRDRMTLHSRDSVTPYNNNLDISTNTVVKSDFVDKTPPIEDISDEEMEITYKGLLSLCDGNTKLCEVHMSPRMKAWYLTKFYERKGVISESEKQVAA